MLGYETIEPGQGHEAGRKLLAKLYRQKTGREMPPILVTDRGKPYFENDGLQFSLSHTKHHVFCVLSEENVGIDAEEADRQIDLRLAQKILSPSERVRYENASDQRVALLKLWVLKEAQAKLTGVGLNGYPKDTDFDPDDPRVRMIDRCYVAILQQGETGNVI